jgi:hypothetical protein
VFSTFPQAAIGYQNHKAILLQSATTSLDTGVVEKGSKNVQP